MNSLKKFVNCPLIIIKLQLLKIPFEWAKNRNTFFFLVKDRMKDSFNKYIAYHTCQIK